MFGRLEPDRRRLGPDVAEKWTDENVGDFRVSQVRAPERARPGEAGRRLRQARGATDSQPDLHQAEEESASGYV